MIRASHVAALEGQIRKLVHQYAEARVMEETQPLYERLDQLADDIKYLVQKMRLLELLIPEEDS